MRRLNSLLQPKVFAPFLAASGLVLSAWWADHSLPVPDEGAVLTLASRILRGEVFYRDVDAYYFPGAAYLLALWMSVFGESVNAARWLAGLVFSSLLVGLYLSSIQLLERGRSAIFGVSLLSLKFLAWPAFTAYMYSDLALCFAAFSVALLLAHPHRGPCLPLAASGALAALATAAKQSLGLYLLAAGGLSLLLVPALRGSSAFHLRERCREVGIFTCGAALVGAPMLGYFAVQGLLWKLLESGLVRPFVAYLPTSGISFATPLAWWNFGELREMAAFPYSVGPYWAMLMNGWLPGESWYPLYWSAGEFYTRGLYTSVLVAAFLAARLWLNCLRLRQVSEGEGKRLAFALLAFAIFFSAFPRADYYHVISVYPFVLLLLFTLVERRAPGRRRAASWGSAVAVLLVVALACGLTVLRHRHETYRMQIERADLYIDPRNSWIESVVRYFDESLGASDRIFVHGNEAYFYFLSGRRYDPWPFVQVYPGQVGGESGAALARTLRAQAPKLIVRGVQSWPGLPAIPSYAQAVDWVVLRDYELADDEVFGSHPPPMGGRPEPWVAQVLRHRRSTRDRAAR